MHGDVSRRNEVEQGKAKMTGVRDRGELHVHLNGAIPVPIIREILADEATELPPGFLIERDLLRSTPCQSLASYLTPWQALPRRGTPPKAAKARVWASKSISWPWLG